MEHIATSCLLKSHSRVLRVSGFILWRRLCSYHTVCCTATTAGAWTGWLFAWHWMPRMLMFWIKPREPTYSSNFQTQQDENVHFSWEMNEVFFFFCWSLQATTNTHLRPLEWSYWITSFSEITRMTSRGNHDSSHPPTSFTVSLSISVAIPTVYCCFTLSLSAPLSASNPFLCHLSLGLRRQ